jgi:hypothetical protein
MTSLFNLDFDWYDLLIEGGFEKDGYRYYIGQKMHPYIPKMHIEGYTDEICQMSSITKIYLPKNNERIELGEFNHFGVNEEAFYCALLNGLYYLRNNGIKRVLVESSNKFMVCSVLNLLFYNKRKRKDYWYTHELMCVLNDFRLFAIKWTENPSVFTKKHSHEDVSMDKIQEPLDPSLAYMYS